MKNKQVSLEIGGKGGIRTLGTDMLYNRFRVCRIRPLCHLSFLTTICIQQQFVFEYETRNLLFVFVPKTTRLVLRALPFVHLSFRFDNESAVFDHSATFPF